MSKNVKNRLIFWNKIYSKNWMFFDIKFIQKIDQKLIKKLTTFWTPKTFKIGPPKSPKSSKIDPPDPFLPKNGVSFHHLKPVDLALKKFPKKFYPRFKPIRGKVFAFCNRAPDPLPWGFDPFLDFFRPDSHISTFKKCEKFSKFAKIGRTFAEIGFWRVSGPKNDQKTQKIVWAKYRISSKNRATFFSIFKTTK